MNSFFKALFILCCLQFCYAQKDSLNSTDTLYKEDQFYIGTTYNVLTKTPKNFSQNGFSNGVLFGFIKDMPINNLRNIAIGIGLGVSLNSYNHNLLIEKDNSNTLLYALLEDAATYSKNKFYRNLIELPIEFRWRTSTPTEYKFWRIYTGIKLGYLVNNATKFRGNDGTKDFRNINDFNKIQYGLTLSAGYNTWNIYLYYGLNPIFSKNTLLNGNELELSTLKVGLIFYIL